MSHISLCSTMSVRSLRSSLRRKQVSMNEARVILMDNTCLKEKFEKNSCVTGITLLRRVGERLSISESELKYFGLKYPGADGQMNWLSLSDPVKKQSPKKPSHFQLGVRVYPEANEELSLDCLRLCCYQIKCDLNRGHLFCNATEHASIDSYFAQAVIGDFTRKTHTPGYLEDFLGSFYIPPSGLNCTAEVNAQEYENEVVKRHQGHCKMTKKEAWLALLNISSTIPQFNALTHQAKDCSDKTVVQISIFEQGIKVYKLNSLGEPDSIKREYDWRVLGNITCYKKKLVMSTSKGVSKFKFSGMYGDMAARRLLEDILECRLFHNCHLNNTDLLAYYIEESKRNEGGFARRSSKCSSFRNEPVLKRKGSMRRVYSSLRSRLSAKDRESSLPSNRVNDEEHGYESRPLSRVEMIPKVRKQ